MNRRCERCGQDNRVPARHLADTGRCGACKETLPPLSEPLDADATTFDEVIQGARVPVLVDFWAPWCGPCRMVAPEVKKVAERMAGKAIVLKVNTESHPALGARFAVRSIPSFAVFSGGHRVLQEAGSRDHNALAQLIVRAA
jgi:thioredoxin 2